ncbi:helix-turn-helix domain-containing protein [uncultured Flavobacterium sp.]|uniref:helix-turn-helix domain-containing protein n=1 Tax=uncultured Flavobacterium sp. TaxID=165435 RepID=UPI0025DE3937|nr:helix-turn-helix domain-containing protein [uncultured Flavobacterium sp.]
MIDIQNITDKELHDKIVEYCNLNGITGYDISKNTGVSKNQAANILKNETVNPRRTTLLKIWNYISNIESGIIKTEPKQTTTTELEKYLALSNKIIELQQDNMDFLKREREYIKTIMQLKKVLEQHNIDYSHITPE